MMELRRVLCAVVLSNVISFYGSYAEQGPTTLELLGRIERLEKQGEEQRTRIHVQEQTIQELSEVVQQQVEHNKHQDSRVAKLQARVSEHEHTITALAALLGQGDRSSSSAVNVRELSQRDDEYTGATEDSNGDVGIRRAEEVPIRQSRIVMDTSGAVAFLVKMNQPEIHLGQTQNVRFDSIVSNIGGGYHTNHGLFIAPVAGIYIFSTSVLSDNGKGTRIEVDIEKNGHRLAGAYASSEENMHDQGSVTVVTELAVSDEVWVSVRLPQTDAAVSGFGYSSFMGCLILPIEA